MQMLEKTVKVIRELKTTYARVGEKPLITSKFT